MTAQRPTAWKAAKTSYIKPTIVINCGSISDTERSWIQQNVRQRLPFDLPLEAVRWDNIESIEDVSAERVKRLAIPLLQWDFRAKMVSLGYAIDVPTHEHPISLQIIVIFQIGENDDVDGSQQFLKKLATATKDSLSDSVEYSIMLIAMGDGDMNSGDYAEYWPRIRLNKITPGGALTTVEVVMEVCTTLVVALIASELVNLIEYQVDINSETPDWIWAGTSSLIVDLFRMKEFLHQIILGKLIQPLIEVQLTPETRLLIDEEMDKISETGQSQLLKSALSITSNYDWQGECQGRQVTRLKLKHDCSLRQKIYLSISDLSEESTPIKIMPYNDLTEELSTHYILARDALVQNMSDPANTNYQRFFDVIGFLLDRSAALESNGEIPLSLQEEWPKGLPAAIYAGKRFCTNLQNGPDLAFQAQGLVARHLIGSDGFLKTIGASDSMVVQANSWQFNRILRTFLSKLGLLLKLIPAWPLLTGILISLSGWDIERSALTSGLLLFAIGAVEISIYCLPAQSELETATAGSNGKLPARILQNNLAFFKLLIELLPERRRREKLRVQCEDAIAHSFLLHTVAKVLRDYRVLVIARLKDVLFTLEQLQDLLHQSFTDVLGRTASSYDRLSAETTIYRLVDFNRCLEWAEYAIVAANATQKKYSSATAALVAEHILPMLKRPTSARHVFEKIDQEAERLTLEYFNQDALQSYVLADRKEEASLREGKKWKWLSQQNQLLGRTASSNAKSFTVILIENDAALEGASGNHSKHWDANWLIARSRLTHEIICIRMRITLK